MRSHCKEHTFDFGLFEILGALVSMALDHLKDQEYQSKFSALLNDATSLRDSAQLLANLILAVPDQTIIEEARGHMKASSLKIDDANNSSSVSGKIDALKLADEKSVDALGLLEGNPIAKAVTSGALGAAITQRLHILRRLHQLIGDTDSRHRYLAFAQSQFDELGSRCVAIENQWDARRTFALQPNGSYIYYVDGQFRGQSDPLDPITGMVDALMTDKRNEIYPTVHPMYKLINNLGRDAGHKYDYIYRHPDSHRIWLLETRGQKAYAFDSDASLQKWFDDTSIFDDQDTLDLFNKRQIGGVITEDTSPYYASQQVFSYATPARYSIFVTCCAPNGEGQLLKAQPMVHVWWKNYIGRLQWIAGDELLQKYFPGWQVQEVLPQQLDSFPVGPNVDR
jgi:hypothetical protein